MTVAVAERSPFDPAFGTVGDAEKRSDFAADDSLPGSFDGPLVRREDEPECPRGKVCQEGLVASEKRSEVHQGRACCRIDEHASVRCFDADRQGIWKQPGGRRATRSGTALRQALARDPAAGREVLDLVLLTGEPGHLRRLQHGVQQHQPRHDGGRNRPTEPALRLADGGVQRPMMNVVDERPVVEARADGREPAAHEAVEEPIDLVPVRDAREGRVLPRQTGARVMQNDVQECGLAAGETKPGKCFDSFFR